ncbi:hypothetical protein H257_09474 [Aphanomyces astaci]|uniref:Transposase Tc1-like domain-containing protein n=1 Tax=Aphanomyces astaci TaxID=112090 RepID=W4G9V6_APHAT|nr:hypothetical protein H257_09474 [Aphanomyces astaci]ETV76455.1 hypothetical protein H257_09474 [Aphanomyces astaci]|eukprot:XP_009834000.1 hypothetical protein H257_09474 [Aphanomyces astaci]
MDLARTRELTYKRKIEVINRLHQLTILGKLPRGAFTSTATHFNLHRTNVSKIWNSYSTNSMMPSSKLGRVGRKEVYHVETVTARIAVLPETQRSTLRDMIETTGVPTMSLHKHLKTGTIQRRSSRLKPLLTDANLLQRLAFCGHVYIVKGQSVRNRACKSKRFIPKVMFLAAVARPRFDHERGVMFDGKIGMWPCVKYLPAARNSRNRATGTLVTTLVNVEGELYRDYVMTRVIPAIKACFPSMNKHVVLQDDNATPHRVITDELLASVSTDGWTFVVRSQPPNSPDLNVLDLGFFASIQALQYKFESHSVDDVIRATLAAFALLESEKLVDAFLTLQAVMRLVLENNGGNQFGLPHLGKKALRRTGKLMTNVSCPHHLV